VAREFEGLLRFGTVKPTGFDQYNRSYWNSRPPWASRACRSPKRSRPALKTQRSNLSGLIAALTTTRAGSRVCWNAS